MAIDSEQGGEKKKDAAQQESRQTGSNTEEASIAISETNEDVQHHIAVPSITPIQSTRDAKSFTKAWTILNWMPKRCRYDAESPPSFTLGMNILLGFVRQCSLRLGMTTSEPTAQVPSLIPQG